MSFADLGLSDELLRAIGDSGYTEPTPIQAGAIPLTAGVFMAELQRDWAREETAGKVAEILLEHGGASATNLAWELQLLAGRPGSGV